MSVAKAKTRFNALPWLGLLSIALTSSVVAQPDRVLVWGEEFDGNELDPTSWEALQGNGDEFGIPGWGNNEIQWYTGRPENVRVADGMLTITARQESFQGFPYTSARIRTLGKQDFRYGRIEARMKLPSTPGIWPAFWMLPTNSPYGGWSASGEIDIMESVNFADTVYGNIYFGGEFPRQQNSPGELNDGTDLGADFNEYAIEWDPDLIRWFINGRLFHVRTSNNWSSEADPDNNRAPFDWPFHIILNVAVGGNFPNGVMPGVPNASSVFPQELVVDYVRVYLSDVEQSPFSAIHQIPGTIEAEDYDLGGEVNAYNDCDPVNRGGEYRPDQGVDIEVASEGGFNVAFICRDEWIEYTVDVEQPGQYVLESRVASALSGAFSLRFAGIDRTGRIDVPNTGGWQNWVTVAREITLKQAGPQIMRFVNEGNGGQEFNLNSFTLRLIRPGDFDRDGRVTPLELSVLSTCIGGPGTNLVTAGCAFASDGDVDGDLDIDLADMAEVLLGCCN